ncbi:hypothetical protein ACQ4PT_015296 [Festuca glaucescens]
MSAVLSREAEAFDIPFHFNSVEERQGHGFVDALRHNLRVRSGEALGVNVALQLHGLLAADTPGRQEVLACVFARILNAAYVDDLVLDLAAIHHVAVVVLLAIRLVEDLKVRHAQLKKKRRIRRNTISRRDEDVGGLRRGLKGRVRFYDMTSGGQPACLRLAHHLRGVESSNGREKFKL